MLIKGAQGLELLDKACAVVFDKTGTLTKGVFEVQKVNPVRNKEELLFLAASAEAGSNHPIAKVSLKPAPFPTIPVTP